MEVEVCQKYILLSEAENDAKVLPSAPKAKAVTRPWWALIICVLFTPRISYIAKCPVLVPTAIRRLWIQCEIWGKKQMGLKTSLKHRDFRWLWSMQCKMISTTSTSRSTKSDLLSSMRTWKIKILRKSCLKDNLVENSELRIFKFSNFSKFHLQLEKCCYFHALITVEAKKHLNWLISMI